MAKAPTFLRWLKISALCGAIVLALCLNGFLNDRADRKYFQMMCPEWTKQLSEFGGDLALREELNAINSCKLLFTDADGLFQTSYGFEVLPMLELNVNAPSPLLRLPAALFGITPRTVHLIGRGVRAETAINMPGNMLRGSGE